MSQSADVRSIDAVRQFYAAVVEFQEEARLCLSSLEMQLLKIMGWLEQDRPVFWKREIEDCYRDQSEARVRLHQCKMRKVGDWKPTCFEEKKALEKAKKDLEFAQKQLPVVKYWNSTAQQEANEYHGRASRMTQAIEREIPALMALLLNSIDRLESYTSVQTPTASVSAPADFQQHDSGDVQTKKNEKRESSEAPDDPRKLSSTETPASETDEEN